ncbi:hypothetical protein MMPV_003571 [Pyropia vietnamensis]
MAARRFKRSALVIILLFFLLAVPPPPSTFAAATAVVSDAEAEALLTLLLGGPASTAAVLAAAYATPPRPLRVPDAARTGRAAWARTRRTWVAREDVDALLLPNVSVASGGGPLRLGEDVTFARPHAGAGGVCERLDVTRMGAAVAADETAVPIAAARDLVATGYAMTVSAVHLRDAAVYRAAVGSLRRAFGVAVTADVTLQPPAVAKLEPGCAVARDVPTPDVHTLVVQLDGERTVLLHPPPSPMPRFGGENAPPLPGLGGSDSDSDDEDSAADRTYTLTEGDVLSVPAGWTLTSATPRDKVSLSLSYRVATPAATVGTLLRGLLAGVSTAPLRGTATSASLAAAAVEVAVGVSPVLLGTPIMPTAILRRAAAWVEGEGDDAPVGDGWGDTHEDPHMASLARAVETFCRAAAAELLSPLLAELAEGAESGEEAGVAHPGVGPGGADGDGGGPADHAGGAVSRPNLPSPSLLGPDAGVEERDLRAWAAGVVGRDRSAAAASVFDAILREMADGDVVAAVAAIAAADRAAAAAVADWEKKILAAHARDAAGETEKDL